MDELAKTKCRNRISAIAYILLAMLGGLFTVSAILNLQFNIILMVGIETLVGVAGIILLILKKRDLTAIVFLMFATLFAYYSVTGGVRYSPVTSVLCWFFILFPLILLTTKEKKAKTYFCVFFPYGIGALVFGYFNGLTVVNVIMHIVFALIALLTGIMFVAEKIQNPFALTLRADENVQFTRAGQCLSFYLLAVFCAVTAVALCMDTVASSFFTSISISIGISLIIIACLLFIFTKMRISSLLTLLAGIAIMLIIFQENIIDNGGTSIFVITGILFVIFAVISVFLKKGVLAAVMFILIGVFYLLMGLVTVPEIISIALLGIAGIIGIYQTFVLLNKKSLPRI